MDSRGRGKNSKAPVPSFKNRGLLGRPSSPVEKPTTTSEGESKRYKIKMQQL
jgi:hypothetical protein